MSISPAKETAMPFVNLVLLLLAVFAAAALTVFVGAALAPSMPIPAAMLSLVIALAALALIFARR
jgi:hypothetical protein